jgi:chemotaxis protein MotB
MAQEKPAPTERKKEQKSTPAGAPAWMVTYSDLVTLLLTFFVLLLSMANMDPKRFSEASISLKEAIGIRDEPAQVDFSIPIIPSPPVAEFSPVTEPAMTKVYEKIRSQIDSLRLSNQIGVLKRDDEAVVLRINDGLLFAPGKSEIAPQSYTLLHSIAEIIRPLPMDLRIEGHTDDQLHSDGPGGNWDLSVERSVAVLRFFKGGDLLALDRMAAVGYGKDRPVAGNQDEAGRALNRRVDFVLRLKPGNSQKNSAAGGGSIPL